MAARGVLTLLAVLQAGLLVFQQRVLVGLGTRLTVAESARFVHHALRLPERYFIARSVADLSLRAQHNREIVNILTGKLASVAVGLIVMIVYGIAMIVISPPLAAITIGLTLLNFVAMRSALNRQRSLSRLVVNEQAALNATTAYGAATMESIKAGGLETDYYARWEGTAVRVGEARQAMSVAAQLDNSIPLMLRALISALVLCVGGLLVIDGRLAIGSLVAFQTLLTQFGAPVLEIVSFSWLLQNVQNLIRRLDDVLDEPVDPSCDPAVQLQDYTDGSPRLDGALALDGVTFGFKPTAPPLIEDFDADAGAGRAGRDRRRVGERQVDARAPHRRAARAVVGHGARRRPPPARDPAPRAGEFDRDGRPEHRPVRRDGARQPDALGRHGRRRSRHARGGGRTDPQRHRRARGRVHVDHAGRRDQLERRSAPAARDRASARARPVGARCSTRRRARWTPTPRPPSNPRFGAAAARPSSSRTGCRRCATRTGSS